jgi:carbon storage regulator CsrA
MLILSRRPNEELRITCKGVRIQVVITQIHGNQAKIGIIAPDEVIIDREEIARKKEREL